MHAAHLASNFTGLVQKGSAARILFSVAALALCHGRARTESTSAEDLHFVFDLEMNDEGSRACPKRSAAKRVPAGQRSYVAPAISRHLSLSLSRPLQRRYLRTLAESPDQRCSITRLGHS